MFNKLEVVTVNFTDLECQNLRMMIRRVYKIKQSDSSMYKSSLALKARVAVESLFLSFNTSAVGDRVQCAHNYSHMKEFEIRLDMDKCSTIEIILVPIKMQHLITVH